MAKDSQENVSSRGAKGPNRGSRGEQRASANSHGSVPSGAGQITSAETGTDQVASDWPGNLKTDELEFLPGFNRERAFTECRTTPVLTKALTTATRQGAALREHLDRRGSST